MFDIAPSELMLVFVVALVVIGPKDLPRAMRFVGQWVGRARGMARHFRSGFDEMVRQAEMEEMEKNWARENARIMAEHPVSNPPHEEIDDAMLAMGHHLPAPDGHVPQVGSPRALPPALPDHSSIDPPTPGHPTTDHPGAEGPRSEPPAQS